MKANGMKVYGFFRSGTSHRLRIALNLKSVKYEYLPVDLTNAKHLTPEFKAVNEQQFVPVVVLDDGRTITQSPAIIEWLEERYPQPTLLPGDAEQRARIRAMAAIVGCDIHPVNNRRILQALKNDHGASQEEINAWCGRWISAGFDAIEKMLREDGSRQGFCFGSAPTIADVYLVPQVESSRRFNVDLSRWPLIAEVEKRCNELEAFREAHPLQQVDAPAK